MGLDHWVITPFIAVGWATTAEHVGRRVVVENSKLDQLGQNNWNMVFVGFLSWALDETSDIVAEKDGEMNENDVWMEQFTSDTVG